MASKIIWLLATLLGVLGLASVAYTGIVAMRQRASDAPAVLAMTELPQQQQRHASLVAGYLQPSKRCNNSMKTFKRGATVCFLAGRDDDASRYLCLNDIVEHQQELLQTHATLDYVCTTMFLWKTANDSVPCVCTMSFPGLDGYRTIVQPRVQDIAAQTDLKVVNGVAVRLPRALTVVNHYGAVDSSSAVQFEGAQVPRLAQALLALGIDIYQD